jgi:hypothetical protein
MIRFYASRMEGWAYADQSEYSVQIFDRAEDAIAHAIQDNYYDPEQNEIRAGYVAVISVDQNGEQLESDDLPWWSAEGCLVAKGEVTTGELERARRVLRVK